MAPQDLINLQRELRKRTKEDRGILKRVFEINVRLDEKQPRNRAPQPLLQAALLRQKQEDNHETAVAFAGRFMAVRLCFSP